MKQTRNPHYIIWTLFQNLTPNSAVFSPQLMKAGTTHVLRRILHFRWLGQTVLRIHLSHGVYANFKVNFSHCASSQFSYVFSFLFLFTVWYVVLILLLSSFCQCQFNLTVAKTIKFYLILIEWLVHWSCFLWHCMCVILTPGRALRFPVSLWGACKMFGTPHGLNLARLSWICENQVYPFPETKRVMCELWKTSQCFLCGF